MAMLFFHRILLILGLCCLGTMAHADNASVSGAYVSGIDDLPLMAGLTQNASPPVDFDQPDGRIVDSTASGRVAPRDVLAFYDKTLPQLGWTKSAPAAYVRENETLTITAHRQGAGTSVHFTLQPKS